jgi:uncharacterized RDD family membrane protein YckC
MLYDGLLVTGLILLATFAFLPWTHGKAILASEVPVLAAIYNFARLIIVVGFFGFFWTHSGQTLGMKAWRLRVQKADGSRLTWKDALLRLTAACASLIPAGLGYFWIWIDRNHLAWHDRWTGTRVVVVPKDA